MIQTVNGEQRIDSRDMGVSFRRAHKYVLRHYRNLECSADFKGAHFAPFYINDLPGSQLSHVMMTRSGFTLLAMKFTGARAHGRPVSVPSRLPSGRLRTA